MRWTLKIPTAAAAEPHVAEGLTFTQRSASEIDRHCPADARTLTGSTPDKTQPNLLHRRATAVGAIQAGLRVAPNGHKWRTLAKTVLNLPGYIQFHGITGQLCNS
jgi:hypothetical protein